MLQLIEATEADRPLLFNLNQKYLYEMTAYYDDPMDAEGNYHYGFFDAYFTDPARRALLLKAGDRLAGFAMLHPYSNFEDAPNQGLAPDRSSAPDQGLAPDRSSAPDQGLAPDHVLAEFTIFPQFRRRGLARQAAALILARYPGRWEIKYNEHNAPAKVLWNAVAAPYHPERRAYSDDETVLVFTAP